MSKFDLMVGANLVIEHRAPKLHGKWLIEFPPTVNRLRGEYVRSIKMRSPLSWCIDGVIASHGGRLRFKLDTQPGRDLVGKSIDVMLEINGVVGSRRTLKLGISRTRAEGGPRGRDVATTVIRERR